jgi:hypothetical protein
MNTSDQTIEALVDAIIGVSQGKAADLVGWSVGPLWQNITVTLPRDTWVAICKWVAAKLQEEKE